MKADYALLKLFWVVLLYAQQRDEYVGAGPAASESGLASSPSQTVNLQGLGAWASPKARCPHVPPGPPTGPVLDERRWPRHCGSLAADVYS